jgi:hypothetical protein
MAYYSNLVPAPDLYGNDDLLQSPLALAVIRSVAAPGKQPVVDFQKDASVKPLKTLQNNTGSPYNFLLIKELLANARYCDLNGNPGRAGSLYDIYKKITRNDLLVEYTNETPLAHIDYVSDNVSAQVTYQLKKDTVVRVFARGQVRIPENFNNNAFECDNIQLFFKAKNPPGGVNNDVMTYEFNYDFKKIGFSPSEHVAVKWLDSSGIVYAFSRPGDKSYALEVRIPWKELNVDKDSIKTNILINDSDLEENKRKSGLSWIVKSGISCFDPRNFGLIKFVQRSLPPSAGVIYAKKTTVRPIIDGVTESVWDNIPYNEVNIQYINQAGRSDNAARFKTCYDNTYLYYFIYVDDNCINTLGVVTTDKCWIENAATGEVVWKMTGKFGEVNPTSEDTQKLGLKAGKYVLKYTSDDSHSFEGWYGKTPSGAFYGASVYNASETEGTLVKNKRNDGPKKK